MHKCPLPKLNQIVAAAGPPLPCGENAPVVCSVPLTNQTTGQSIMQPTPVCLAHAVEIVSMKLQGCFMELGGIAEAIGKPVANFGNNGSGILP